MKRLRRKVEEIKALRKVILKKGQSFRIEDLLHVGGILDGRELLKSGNGSFKGRIHTSHIQGNHGLKALQASKANDRADYYED